MAAFAYSTSSSSEIAGNDKLFNTIFEDAIKEFLEDPKTPKPADNPFVRYVNDRKERLATEKTKNKEDPIEQTEECIRQFEKHWTGSMAYNLRERVDPFIKGITSLIKSCESLLQSAPFGAGIAISGFRIVLELSFKAHEAVDEILKALEEVQPLLECYKITATSQHSSPEMSRAIQMSFKNILELWAHAAKILSKRYTRATVSLIIKPLKDVIQEFRHRAREDAQRVDRLLSALMSREKAMETKQKEKAKKQEAKHLLRKWIIGGEQDDLLGARNELKLRDQDRASGTCKWIFERQEFKDWRDAKGKSVLWYNALPGSGKSVLASAVINHLQQQPESEVVYFFYTFKSTSTRQETCGLRSIALQLLSKLDEASSLNHLTAQYDTAINEGRLELSNNDSDEVVKLLVTLLTHPQFAQVYVVLDGLDECSIKRYGDHSFPGLRQLLNLEALGAVKWYLSSRDIPEIRSLKEASEAVELEPNLADTSKDIWTFLDSQMICPKHDEPLFDIDEHIFLYAAIICRIAKDKTFGTKEAMFDLLQSFAEDFKDLTACYLKSLARIKGLGDQKRDLAIRTFRLLALSVKQLTLMELVDALNLYINPKDDPFIKLEDSDGSQKVSLFHKSVRDFFFEPGNREKIEEYLPGFFMEELSASENLGVNCIQYLNDQRYQSPGNLKGLVTENPSSYGNAFLRYAAVFWHIHLRNIEPKSETLKHVTEFLKSPGFWTCIYVQSHTAPHLFARYKRTSDNHYQPMMGTTSDSPFDFGLPLPQWRKESSSADYASLDRSFCDFVQDWGELLAKNPDRLHHARPLTLYEPTCCLNPPNRLQNLRIKHVSNLIKPKSGMHILETCFPTSGKKRGQTLRLRVVREDGVFPDRQIKVDTLDLFSRPKSGHSRDEIIESPAPGGQWITTIARDINKGKLFLQSWTVNNYDLTITRRRLGNADDFSITRRLLGNSSGDQIYRPPNQLYNDLNLQPNDKGIWNLVQLDVVTQPTRKDGDPVTRLFHYRKCHSSIQLQENARSSDDAINRDSGSYTSSDSDEHSDWGYESGDDSDSSDAPGVNEEKHGNIQEPKARDTGSKDSMTECFIVASDFGKPVWRLFPAHHQLWSRVIGTRHPTRPIVAISHTSGLVDIINDEDGLSSSLEVPENGQDEAAKAVASSREVQFSPCGSFLTLLSVFFYTKDAYVECQVTASCFEFTQSPSGDRFQASEFTEFATLNYIFPGLIGELPRPYIITTWTAECVIITLPPLNYSPKIIKLPLWPREWVADTSGDVPLVISTLTNPVFFPQSTVSRNPHILYCDGCSRDKDSYLYLILDTPDTSSSCPESTLRCGPGHFRGSEDGQATSKDERADAWGPVVMGWRIVGTGKASSTDADKSAGSDTQENHAWREWRDEDQSSEDVKAKRSASEEFQILRGDFVGETYSVPIRSGLNWTREGFLTC
ncbi:putative vegetatible incompatibility het-E-1 [Fusarium globosum]|uniref:Putative vegetatible incompatibility het-E-1 n=1 Tax=Fusarium globosum TaxID=78864 RepID=A0A8H5YE16_9HYPO|nr:putative vegetatible incompatibility het-E-1 [Fusarium globosum]